MSVTNFAGVRINQEKSSWTRLGEGWGLYDLSSRVRGLFFYFKPVRFLKHAFESGKNFFLKVEDKSY